ncbi:MAG: monovalent cation/H+ antiporter subunit D family protein, partial [Alphaproteobacteria bacterium]
MSATALLLLALGAPWGGAVLIALLGDRPFAREAAAMVTASVLFLAVAALFPHVAAGGRPGVALVEILPGLALAFEAEPLGALFALVASSLWLVTTVYSIGYM